MKCELPITDKSTVFRPLPITQPHHVCHVVVDPRFNKYNEDLEMHTWMLPLP